MLTRGAQVTGVAVCSLCLTWISVSLRFYVRIRILKFIGREDWLTLAAMLVFTTFCVLLLVTESYGLGAHMEAIPEAMKHTATMYIFICELLYVVATAVVKLSIGVFYLRLSNKKYQIRIVHATLAIVMLFSTMYFFFLLFQCSPINYLWRQFEVENGSCINSNVLINVTYAHAAMSGVTDWSFGILPIFFVWKLKMTARTKFSVILILSLGFFASSATIVRIVYIRQLQNTTDYSWFGINLVKWSMVEPAIAITAAAIATLRPLFANFFTSKNQRFSIGSSPYKYNSHNEDGSETEGRMSGSSRGSLGQEYTEEFAQMLGLQRWGVTTHISAGKPMGKRQRMKKEKAREKGPVVGDGDSQHELNIMKHEEEDCPWGIKRTTVVVVEA